MKKSLVIALMAGIFLLPFWGCKKGENDPFLSLKSRKSRITGEWRLLSGTAADSSYDKSGNEWSVMTTVYDGAFATTTVTGQSAGSPSAYTMKIVINKDGSFESTTTEEYSFGGATIKTTVEKGTWNFTGGVGDKKNKEQVLLTITEEIRTYSPGGISFIYNYSGNQNTELFDLDRLSNKEMVTLKRYVYTDSDGDQSIIFTKFTLVQ